MRSGSGSPSSSRGSSRGSRRTSTTHSSTSTDIYGSYNPLYSQKLIKREFDEESVIRERTSGKVVATGKPCSDLFNGLRSDPARSREPCNVRSRTEPAGSPRTPRSPGQNTHTEDGGTMEYSDIHGGGRLLRSVCFGQNTSSPYRSKIPARRKDRANAV